MVVVLLWHRLEWGFEEWIHEVTFFNFWNGTYVIISGSKLYTYRVDHKVGQFFFKESNFQIVRVFCATKIFIFIFDTF
jgi:hypothetical protein